MNIPPCPAEQNNTPQPQMNTPRSMTVTERIFQTNWGIVVVGVLVSIGILAASIHAKQTKAQTTMTPPTAETAFIVPTWGEG